MDIITDFGSVVPGSSPGGSTMKEIPFSKEEIEALVAEHPTPFYMDAETGIRASARALIDAFSWNSGFTEYFAVKATPNPEVLKILKEEGCGADCSSLAELLLSERVGIVGEQIMFTSNNTPAEEFIKAKELGALINLDDLSHLAYLEEHAGLPKFLSFRYNPGTEKEGNTIIGSPEEAKFGLTRAQMFTAYRLAKEKGVKRFGIHTMVASNELNPAYFVDTARMLFALTREIMDKEGIVFDLINLGGGIGIPYRSGEEPVDLSVVSRGIQEAYEEFNLAPVRLSMECGRLLTGPHGYLVSTVRHLKDTHKQFVGLDASMADLMRPGMYGAHHHISVLGKEHDTEIDVYDVTGSLCENNDKFAINRSLPKISIGDRLVIHDAGAHGHAMGFNYNGKLRCAEFLLTKERQLKMIRRAETLEDYFSTLEY